MCLMSLRASVYNGLLWHTSRKKWLDFGGSMHNYLVKQPYNVHGRKVLWMDELEIFCSLLTSVGILTEICSHGFMCSELQHACGTVNGNCWRVRKFKL